MAQYSDLLLSEETLKAVERMGFTELTEIQEKAIPVMLEGREIIAKAPTGTGKTCAFGVPIMEKIDPSALAVQAVVLCPTREHADCGRIARACAFSSAGAGRGGIRRAADRQADQRLKARRADRRCNAGPNA